MSVGFSVARVDQGSCARAAEQPMCQGRTACGVSSMSGAKSARVVWSARGSARCGRAETVCVLSRSISGCAPYTRVQCGNRVVLSELCATLKSCLWLGCSISGCAREACHRLTPGPAPGCMLLHASILVSNQPRGARESGLTPGKAAPHAAGAADGPARVALLGPTEMVC